MCVCHLGCSPQAASSAASEAGATAPPPTPGNHVYTKADLERYTHTDKHNTNRPTERERVHRHRLRQRSICAVLWRMSQSSTSCPVTVSPTCAYGRCLVMLGSSPRLLSGPPSSRTSSRYAHTYIFCVYTCRIVICTYTLQKRSEAASRFPPRTISSPPRLPLVPPKSQCFSLPPPNPPSSLLSPRSIGDGWRWSGHAGGGGWSQELTGPTHPVLRLGQ